MRGPPVSRRASASFRSGTPRGDSRQAPGVDFFLEPTDFRISGGSREQNSLWKFASTLQSVYLGHGNQYHVSELLFAVEAIVRHVLGSLSERVHTPLDAAGLPRRERRRSISGDQVGKFLFMCTECGFHLGEITPAIIQLGHFVLRTAHVIEQSVDSLWR